MDTAGPALSEIQVRSLAREGGATFRAGTPQNNSKKCWEWRSGVKGRRKMNPKQRRHNCVRRRRERHASISERIYNAQGILAKVSTGTKESSREPETLEKDGHQAGANAVCNRSELKKMVPWLKNNRA